jgi:hypothetical protein
MMPLLADTGGTEDPAAERDAEEVGRRNFMRMMRHFSTYFTRNAAQGG